MKILVILYLIILLIPFFVRKDGNLFFRPDRIISMGAMYYSLPLIYNILKGNDFWNNTEIILFMYILFHATFLLCYFKTNKKRNTSFFSQYSKVKINRVIKLSFLFFIFYFIAIYIEHGNIISYFSMSRLDRFSSHLFSNTGAIASFFKLVIMSFIILLYIMIFNLKNKYAYKKEIVYFLLLLLSYLFIDVLHENRRFILLLLIGFGFIAENKIKIKSFVVLPIAVLCIPFLYGFGTSRGLDAPLSEKIVFAIENSSSFSSIEVIANVGENQACIEIFDKIIDYTKVGDFLYFENYLYPLTFLIPRFIYHDRPLGLPDWYTLTYHPDVYDKGGGFAFSFIGEAYFSFGILGVIIVAAIFAFIIKKIWIRSNSNIWMSFLMALIIGRLLILYRLDSVSLFKEIFFCFFPIYILSSVFIFNKKNRYTKLCSKK